MLLVSMHVTNLFVVVVIIVVLVTMILIDKPLPDWMIPFLFYIQV